MQTIFLAGPTAVGKSAVALELASRLDAEIISADSMQVYRGMDIGTAKAKSEEIREIRHHLLDVCEVHEVFDVKRFVGLATQAIADIHIRGKTVLVVGGTGLYVRALRLGLFEGPSRDAKLRERLEAMPTTELFSELERVDALTASRIDRHNPRRLVRALEVFHTTGKPIAQLQKEWKVGQTSRLSSSEGNRGRDVRATIAFCLTRDRAELNARIEQRIDAQIAAGWGEEVRALMARGLERNPTAMQAAGYRELAAHLRGEFSLAEAVALIKTRTRQLAKRQMTWFRREADLVWLAMEPSETPSRTAQRVIETLKEREPLH